MTTTYTFSEARQKFSAVLEEAERVGEVRIKRRNGRIFVIRPEKGKRSPLDVEGIDVKISADQIVEIVREGRRRGSGAQEG
jgi:PHD/YefM family antitoxin component YafN of YafNO toxin-antitoxin module